MNTTHGSDRLPDWFKVRINTNKNYKDLRSLVKNESLNTVCEEAACPNIHECWGTYRTAAFMILGDVCTRHCRFCDVRTGRPGPVDPLEPRRVAASVHKMRLTHAFVTMVNRDDLDDGGASVLAATVEQIRELSPGCGTEVLSSDLAGRRESIRTLVKSAPDIIGHNIETVRRLTPHIRSRSTYERSLGFLETAKDMNPDCVTKTSIMVGLGETRDEVIESMDDLRRAGVDMLNIGQYLQPSRDNEPVSRYWKPEEFAELRDRALERGFIHCESGPLVRSSYHAGDQFEAIHTGDTLHGGPHH